jgi:hypothetical protein
MTNTSDIYNKSVDLHEDNVVSKKETNKKNSYPEYSDVSSARKKKSKAEIGGPSGPEPTRFGDWERRGRCIDF